MSGKKPKTGRGKGGTAVPPSAAAPPTVVIRVAKSIRRGLLAAYDAGKRDLPWREETDPYRIWVSEIMLQQTRVETVLPYYEKWLRRFPNLDSLAAAEEDEVLRMWQGLGYYSRARRLLEGAQVVRERFGGSLPGSAEGLREIPGIGEYTAGAVASIAFGEAVPAVDGNVKRVLSRLFDLEAPGSSEYRTLAERLVDPERPGDFNQALMELGALVCVPRNPRCENCPVSGDCLALERGTVAERPMPKLKKPVPEVDIAVLVAVAGPTEGRGLGSGPEELSLLVQKRPSSGLLAGMWEFPGVELEVGPEPGRGGNARVAGAEAAVRGLAGGLGLFQKNSESQERLLPLTTVTHVFSHLKARYHPFLFLCGGPTPADRGGPALTSKETGPGSRDPEVLRQEESGLPQWISVGALEQIPLPVAQSKIAAAALAAVQ